MRSPELALMLAALALAAPLAAQPKPDDDAAVERAVVKDSYRYFTLKDGGDYTGAYKLLAPSMRSYLTLDIYKSESERFNAEAGKVEERRVTRVTVYHDPPDAPTPGTYVAADFVAKFPNIHLHCGYLMWHREGDGSFRVVREEQSFIDKGMARQLPPERLNPLAKQFGCVGE